MKALYLDIFSGISGDMLIGALLDLGVDFHKLEHELEKLGIEGFHLHSKRAQKAAIEGVKFDVHLAHEHSHEHTHAGGVKHTHAHAHDRNEHEHEHHHDHEHSHKHDHDHEHEHDDHHGHAHAHEHEYEHEHGRNYRKIKELISGSSLSSWVKEKAAAVFHRIAV